jgi:hypothetical protein
VLSISSLIDLILKLLQDPDAQAEFARDPHGMLAQNGLQDLTAQDVCDVAPMVADHPAVSAKHGDYQPSLHNDDPVGALSHIKDHYVVNKTLVTEKNYDLTYVDDRDTIVNVDDRDTTSIQAEGDVTIEDSFNQDNDVNLIEDSFNQDNDGVDNKDGSIEQAAVAGATGPEHGASGDDDPESESAGAGTAEADPSGDSTANTGLTDQDSADSDSSGLTEPDSAERDFTEADESSVDPSDIDDDDPGGEDHAGDEFNLVG